MKIKKIANYDEFQNKKITANGSYINLAISNENVWRKMYQLFVKTLEHEYIFSKYSQNLNISELFCRCYTKNNFPIIIPKFKKPHFLKSIEI